VLPDWLREMPAKAHSDIHDREIRIVKHCPPFIDFNSFWTIELDEGWSLFATHPVNRDDLPFRLISGLVDADRFHDGGINFPAIWTQPDFTGVLPKGTPVAQCFAVPRVTHELVIESFDQPHFCAS
jgi:hypothetical protein